MRLALVILLTTLVATCGQKGPLRLPAPEAEVRAVDRAVEVATQVIEQSGQHSGAQT